MKINRTFFSGFIFGTLFSAVLIIGIQAWDMFRSTRQTPSREQAVSGPSAAGSARVTAPPTVAIPPPPAKIVTFDDLEGKPAQGPRKAVVMLVEFSDFHCPFCKRVSLTLDQLMKNYPGKIMRVWRHFPLSIHPGAGRAHEASECAHEQGKFWEFHNEFFGRNELPSGDEALKEIAKKIGLNKNKFERCLESGQFKERVQRDIARGQEAGVRGTPSIFINGEIISGNQPYDNFARAVQRKLDET